MTSGPRICGLCWKELLKFSSRILQSLGETPVRGIFPWTRDLNPQVSTLIQELKGGINSQVWPELADLFLTHHWPVGVKFLHSENPPVLVPVPSKRQSQDHAWQFATALSKILGWPVLNAGESLDSSSQKLKSKHQRARARFNGRHNIPDSASHAILIDDILTTGSTARAVMNSIQAQRLKQKVPGLTWEIWVVAQRHLASNPPI